MKLSIKLFKPTFAGYSKLTHVLFHACLKKKHPDFLLFLGRGGCLLVTIRRNDNPKVIRGKSNWKGFIGWWKMCVHCHLTCNCIRVHVHRKGFVWQCFNYSKMCQRGEHRAPIGGRAYHKENSFLKRKGPRGIGNSTRWHPNLRLYTVKTKPPFWEMLYLFWVWN